MFYRCRAGQQSNVISCNRTGLAMTSLNERRCDNFIVSSDVHSSDAQDWKLGFGWWMKILKKNCLASDLVTIRPTDREKQCVGRESKRSSFFPSKPVVCVKKEFGTGISDKSLSLPVYILGKRIEIVFGTVACLTCIPWVARVSPVYGVGRACLTCKPRGSRMSHLYTVGRACLTCIPWVAR